MSFEVVVDISIHRGSRRCARHRAGRRHAESRGIRGEKLTCIHIQIYSFRLRCLAFLLFLPSSCVSLLSCFVDDGVAVVIVAVVVAGCCDCCCCRCCCGGSVCAAATSTLLSLVSHRCCSRSISQLACACCRKPRLKCPRHARYQAWRERLCQRCKNKTIRSISQLACACCRKPLDNVL